MLYLSNSIPNYKKSPQTFVSLDDVKDKAAAVRELLDKVDDEEVASCQQLFLGNIIVVCRKNILVNK